MSVHELTVTYRLPNNTTNKLEIIQMIHIYHAQRVGLESGTVSRSRKQGVVTVKYFTGQNKVPFTSQAACINSCRSKVGKKERRRRKGVEGMEEGLMFGCEADS